ncbi:MAG: helix-turn-helix transcriptional regulator [Flavobacteriia bacterium]|nr:helix-turn-helix transcriptional regulator [Flavobacteriia bacterium]
MYKIESGKVGMSISKLAVITKALNVSLTELVVQDDQ